MSEAPSTRAGPVFLAAALLLCVHAALLVLDARAMGLATDEANYFNGGRIVVRHGWVHEATLYQGPLALYANQLFVRDFPDGGLAPARPERGLLLRGRLGTLPFALLSALLVFVWARRVFGDAGGLFALLLHALNPLMLGYGALMLVDAQHATVTLLVLFLLWRWLETRSRAQLAGLGVALGLALATKYLAAFLAVSVGLTVFVAAVGWPRGTPAGKARGLASAAAALGTLALCAFVTLHAAYRFRGGLGSPAAIDYSSEAMRSLVGTPALGRIVALLPAPFLRGVDFQLLQGQRNWAVFLNGVTAPGHHDFFVWSILCKTPEIVLACAALVGVLLVRRALSRGWEPGWKRLAVATWPYALVILFYLSFLTRMQVGIRYVLPLFPLLFLWQGALFAGARLRSRWFLAACALVIAVHALELRRNWPDWVAYYNRASGGQRLAFRRFRGTNSDFGQYDPGGPELLRARHGDLQVLGPASGARFGRLAVSNEVMRAREARFDWLLWLEPVAHLGASWWLFELTPEALEQRVESEGDPLLRRDLCVAHLGAGARAPAERLLAQLPRHLAAPIERLIASEDAARARPARPELESLIQGWKALGRIDRAEAVALEHPDELASSRTALQARIQAMEERQDFAGAIALFDSFELDPADPTRLWLVRDLRVIGEHARAREVFQAMARRLGDAPQASSDVFVNLGLEIDSQHRYLELLRSEGDGGS